MSEKSPPRTILQMQGFDPANAIPAEEVYRQNGITKAALDSMDEVEFE